MSCTIDLQFEESVMLDQKIFHFFMFLFYFQAIEGDKMYTYYYLLYTLQIFLDGKLGNRPPVNVIPEDKVIIIVF